MLVADANGVIVGVNIAKIRSSEVIPIYMPRRYMSIGPIAVSINVQHQGIEKK